jgi:hypothetical protein
MRFSLSEQSGRKFWGVYSLSVGLSREESVRAITSIAEEDGVLSGGKREPNLSTARSAITTQTTDEPLDRLEIELRGAMEALKGVLS